MEKQLEYSEPLSLKDTALRKVIVQLLISADVLTPISKLRHNTHEIAEIDKKWRRTIEPKIKNNVLSLNLPQCLMEEMLKMVKPIGLQIKRWKDRQDYHFRNENQEISLSYLSEVCWTVAGLIDYRKTAQELVCCDALDIVLRYKLACINCLEENIPLLWEELPRKKKVYFYNIVRYQKPPSPRLHFCWPHIFKYKLSNLAYLLKTSDGRNLTSFNQWAFEQSAEKGNKIATKYFFQKLTDGERWVSLTRTGLAVQRKMFGCVTASDELSEVFFYLLSVMTPVQRIEIFKGRQRNRSIAVSSFLDWPWPDLFLEDIRHFWNLIPQGYHQDLYWEMSHRLKSSYFPKLFPVLFKHSPLNFKKCFKILEWNNSVSFLCSFLVSENTEAIRSLLRNVGTEVRKQLVNRPCVFRLFHRNIAAGKFQAVKVCLLESSGTPDKALWTNGMKKSFTYGLVFEERRMQKYKRFLEYFAEPYTSVEQEKKPQKRKIEYFCLE